MNLKPARIVIDPENPYSTDLLGRNKILGNTLTNLCKSAEDGFVLCLEGEWGSGKTTFVDMWRADIQSQGVRSIYYNAYENDHVADPFIAFSAEIIDELSEDPYENKAEAFKKTAGIIVKNGGKASLRIMAKLLTLGVIDNTALEEVESDIAAAVADLGTVVAAEAIDSFIQQKSERQNFNQALSELSAKVREETDSSLVIVVDELDRCAPSFALTLLERIKHYFSQPNICFVLAVNSTQLQSSVGHFYGPKIDAARYLTKFFNIHMKLPPLGRRKIYPFIQAQAEHHSNADIDVRHLSHVAEVNMISLRQIQRIVVKLAICQAAEKSRSYDDDGVYPEIKTHLICISILEPTVIDNLVLEKIGYTEVHRAIKGSNYALPSSSITIDHHLQHYFSETQLHPNPFGVERNYRVRRNLIQPFLVLIQTLSGSRL